MDGLAAKILHGWLQNRHQTLFPLTVNLRSLTREQAAVLAEWTAVAALATRPSNGDAQARAAAREWLGSVGADAAVIAVLDQALTAPPPLHRALAAMAGHGLAAYAFVAALVAADPRDPATAPFLDYVAARLALPTTVISAARRPPLQPVAKMTGEHAHPVGASTCLGQFQQGRLQGRVDPPAGGETGRPA